MVFRKVSIKNQLICLLQNIFPFIYIFFSTNPIPFKIQQKEENFESLSHHKQSSKTRSHSQLFTLE